VKNQQKSAGSGRSGRIIMSIGKRFRSIYFSDAPLTEKDYKTSRTWSIFEGISEKAIFYLTSGAFLAGFVSYLGGGDSFNGLIGALPVFAGIVQLISPILLEKMEKRKMLVSFLCFFHRFLLSLMVFIPYMAKGQSARLALVAIIYFVSLISVNFIYPAASGWLIDLTPKSIRGKFFGSRESYVLGIATIVTIVMSRVLDMYKTAGNVYGGFILVFLCAGAFSVINFITYSSMKEPPVKRDKSNINLKKIVTIPLKDKKFRKIILLYIFWNIGVQVGAPFLAVYMVTGLKLSYTYIMSVTILSTLVNVLTVRIWGNIADKRSWAYVIKLSILILALTHFTWLFVNAQTADFLVPVLQITSGLAWAGIGISTFNIQFAYSPEEGRTVYIGFNAALGGLIGFLSTLAGAFFIGVFKDLKLSISGFTFGNMQIVFAISGILLAVCVAYIHIFIKEAQKNHGAPDRADTE